MILKSSAKAGDFSLYINLPFSLLTGVAASGENPYTPNVGENPYDPNAGVNTLRGRGI